MTGLTAAPATAVRPHWTERAAPLALLWSFLYGAVQGWFALGHEPEWPWGVGLFVPAWAAAGLCAVAFALVAALISRPQ